MTPEEMAAEMLHLRQTSPEVRRYVSLWAKRAARGSTAARAVARAKTSRALGPERRQAIARKAALARWAKHKERQP